MIFRLDREKLPAKYQHLGAADLVSLAVDGDYAERDLVGVAMMLLVDDGELVKIH